MIRTFSLLIFFGLLAANAARGRTQYAISLSDRMLDQIREPMLHAYNGLENTWANAHPVVSSELDAVRENPLAWAPLNVPPDIPQFRKYQNRHIAPTRIYAGSAAVVVGGMSMYAGYRQDTKYEWSGPYMSSSPLNVFGALIVLVGLCFIASGLIFYSKYKKHTIAPYNKSY